MLRHDKFVALGIVARHVLQITSIAAEGKHVVIVVPDHLLFLPLRPLFFCHGFTIGRV